MVGYQEAADLLGIRKGTLYAWVCAQKIPHIRYSARLVRFDADELAEWVRNRRQEAKSDRNKGVSGMTNTKA